MPARAFFTVDNKSILSYNTSMQKFEAVYYEGEDNERLPEWRVIEWDASRKIGSTIQSFYNMCTGEADAKFLASVLQQAHDQGVLTEI